MYVGELRKQLEQFDDSVWVDVMFADDSNVYTIVQVEQLKLSDGQLRVIIDISGDTPLKAV